MSLAHGHVDLLAEGSVEVAELAVLVGLPLLGIGLRVFAVLEPQQHQRHALASQLAVNDGEVDGDASTRLLGASRWIEPTLEFIVEEFAGELPTQVGSLRSPERATDRALGHPRRDRDLPMGATVLKTEAEYFSDLSHTVLAHPRDGDRCGLRLSVRVPAGPSLVRYGRAELPRPSAQVRRNRCPGASESAPRSVRNRCPSVVGIGAQVRSEYASEAIGFSRRRPR